jgi:hypothetical protein
VTPAAKRTRVLVTERFSSITKVGTYNRRRIAGTSKWSQHSWANALDLHVNTIAQGDRVAAWLTEHEEELGIKLVLWRHPNHWDVPPPLRHVHVDFWPKGIGTPPLTQLGSGYFQYSDGSRVKAPIRYIPPEGKGIDEMPFLSDEAQQFYESAYQEQKKNLNPPTTPAWITAVINFVRTHPSDVHEQGDK